MAKTAFSLLCVPILIGYCFISCLAVRLSNFTDQSALLVVKSYLDLGSRNILENNWSSTVNVCNWMGVTCNSHHERVTILNLHDMGLRGTIPPQIGNLSFLVHLNLSNNDFHGRLPNELGHLRRLQYLDVQENYFKGRIPYSIFNISSLKRISFYRNNFSGSLPVDICDHLPKLELLSFDSNDLDGPIPSTISKCSQLRRLSLRANRFTGGIPREIGNFTMLNYLTLTLNELEGSYTSLHSVTIVLELYQKRIGHD